MVILLELFFFSEQDNVLQSVQMENDVYPVS